MKGNANMTQVFEPKRENCTRKPIEEGKEFLFLRGNTLVLGESQSCDECGKQGYINSQTLTTAFPVSLLHKYKLYLGSVQEINWCEALGSGACEDCYTYDEAVNE